MEVKVTYTFTDRETLKAFTRHIMDNVYCTKRPPGEALEWKVKGLGIEIVWGEKLEAPEPFAVEAMPIPATATPAIEM